MNVLICGGRDFADADLFDRTMSAAIQTAGYVTIIEGGAKGADALARCFARQCGHECRTFSADWKAHGRGAGPRRNQRMIDEGKPDVVVAFPGGRGTADMVGRARRAGVRVIEVAA